MWGARTCTPSCSTSRATAAESTPVAADGSLGADAARVTAILDGRSTTFELARTGDRSSTPLLRVRADAPYACKGGVCGTCRAKLLDGEVRMDRNYALEHDELEPASC